MNKQNADYQYQPNALVGQMNQVVLNAAATIVEQHRLHLESQTGHRWLPIPGVHEVGYLVSDQGGVYSVRAEQYCHFHSDKKGGYMVRLTTNGLTSWVTVPKLVAACYLTNDDIRKSYMVHINGDRTDNRAENLRYATRRELTQEIVKAGVDRRNKPKAVGPRNLNSEDVALLHAAYAAGTTIEALARYFGISNSAIISHIRYNTHDSNVMPNSDNEPQGREWLL